jgi:K+-sensing histidine kinase KdpD
VSRGLRRLVREQGRELERQDAARTALLAELAHDLRTPLASLRGYLDTLLLKDAGLEPEERRRFLEIAARQSERMGERLAELLELARLGARDFRIRPEPVELAELVHDIVQEQGLRVPVEVEGALPMVLADIGLLERALRRLLGGSPSGVALADHRRHVRVELAFSGRSGVYPDAMVRRILELHDAALALDNTDRHATRLSFSLPLA